MRVFILGANLSARTMYLTHNPDRAESHSAPTTHLRYDNLTRVTLEDGDFEGHTVRLTRGDGKYFFIIL